MKKVTEDVRKLAVIAGTTYYMTLPLEMIRGLGWKKGEKKIIKLGKERIVITDWKKVK